MNWLIEWIRTTDLWPHGFCYQWKPGLIWLHVSADALIALAYFSIPVVLVRFARKRRDLPFSWIFLFFGAFIAACGMTHVMEILTLWLPWYWLSGGIKAITALASLPTAVFVMSLMPKALSLPSQEQLKKANEELLRQGAILKSSEERFRQMAENIHEIFWTMNPLTRDLTYISPAFEVICERSVESLYSEASSYWELIHPDDRKTVLETLEGLPLSNQLDLEFRIVCPGGTLKWLRAIGSTARDETGVVQAFVGTAQEITARKNIEHALREREDLFHDLVEHSSDLVCTHTLDGRFLSVNEMPAHILGCTREELLSRPMREFLAPEVRAQFEDYLAAVRDEGHADGLMVVITKTGERRIWEYHNTLRKDGVSTPVVRGIAHDVTEQVRAQRALRLSEEKFSKAFLASPTGLVISTIDEGRLVEVNESFVRISGFSREEAIGRTSTELNLWTNSTDRDAMLAEIELTGHVRSRQITFQDKKGKPLIINFSAEVIELAGTKHLLSVCEDISERKRAELKLLEYEKVVEGVEEMIAVIDSNYRYLLANRAFTAVRQMTREQVIGRSVSDLLGQEFFEQAVKSKVDEALKGNVVRYEVTYSYPATDKRDIAVSYFPIEGPAGVDRVVCVLQDITERKRAEEELRRLSGRLLRLQDEERRKIARDLHDSTGQDLVALSTTLAQLHDEIPTSNRKWRRLLTGCGGLADRCLREVRTLSYLLHPPMLDEAGLEDAIRHFADGFEQRTGIDVEIEVPNEFGRLPQDLELALFRVVQESLTNVQRHSGSYSGKDRSKPQCGAD